MVKMIVGNWKATLTVTEELGLATDIAKHVQQGCAPNIVLCPSFLSIARIALHVKNSECIKLGAQNCWHENKGAYTGEVSPVALKEIGCEYVILGHSERKILQGETLELIRKKIEAAHNAMLNVIVCVGENQDEFVSGKTTAVLNSQLEALIPQSATHLNTIIAYEPVWAIGSSKTPTKEDVECAIYTISSNRFVKGCKVLYGGSVSDTNAKMLLECKGVGGLLVGGASVDAKKFMNIVEVAGKLLCTQF